MTNRAFCLSWPFLQTKGFKFLILLLVAVCAVRSLAAQEKPLAEKVYVTAEQMPEFPGGQTAMLKYLAGNFRINLGITQDSVNGSMVASFVISKEGKVTQVEIVKKLLPSLDQELVRVVSSMPDWKPGMQNGQPVAVRSSVPFKVVWKGLTTKDVIETVLDNSGLTKKEDNPKEDWPLMFPGGEKAFWEYMKENGVSVQAARDLNLEGVFAVHFVISEKGKIAEVNVLKPPHRTFEQTVIKALKNMPTWQVNEKQEKAVPVTFGFIFGVKSGEQYITDEEQEKIFLAGRVYHTADQEPSFPGGRPALVKYFSENIVYPETAIKDQVKGTLTIQYVINSWGEVERVQVKEPLHPAVEEAMIDVFKRMPAWRPGKVQGKLVSVQRELSFSVAKNAITLQKGGPAQVKTVSSASEALAMVSGQNAAKATLAGKASQKPTASLNQLPEFPGGEQAMWEFMKVHKASLEDANRMKVAGIFEAEFLISETGKVKDVKIIRPLHPDFSRVVIKALEEMPLWKPAKQAGKAVPVIHSFSYEVTEGERRPWAEEVLEEKVYLSTEQRPEFPGGPGSLQKYIAKNIQYPENAKQDKASGTIVLNFIVDSQGKVQSLELEQKVHPGLDEALLTVFQQMPPWNPAMQNNRKVSCRLKIPFMVTNNTVVPVGNW
ncbi:energy transducer TonB [Rufibacter latericius]|uniref:TonB family protein n=1 Tax=Rufibacter latericius TaxID=2487040 RepID=A0A3M9ML37_9BACT|nr:energy transducer TonB [Rufibacter latericius]RNI25927.1 TonB family protein [Rufibacter latericius]